jgi:hypothetical protein
MIAPREDETIIQARYGNGGIRTIVFSSPGYEISPAVILALIMPKTTILLSAFREAAKMMRLETAVGIDVDSWAWQFYGDLLTRLPGQATQDFREHVQCLLHQVYEGEEFHFLPWPTEKAIDAFFACFGIITYTPPLSGVTNYLEASLPWGSTYWAAHSLPIPEQETRTGWASTTVVGTAPGNAWSSFGVAFFVLSSSVPDERASDFMQMLLRRTKPFGAVLNIYMADSIPNPP